MIELIKDFVREHPWWTGIAIFMLGFILNSIRRLMASKARMSVEEKLELRMLRAAMALRKLGRARRILGRYIAVHTVASNVAMPMMVRRLWRASSDAKDAASHLSAVLNKITKIGVSPGMLVNLDHSIAEARGIQETCRKYGRSFTRTDPSGRDIDHVQFDHCWHEVASHLKKVQTILDSWLVELTNAKTSISTKMDPVIVRSGGIFRNPLKPETAVEEAQTRSVLMLRQSQNDFHRVEKCAATIQQNLVVLEDYQVMKTKELAKILGNVLDEIDNCLAEAELPLPVSLVSAESLLEDNDILPDGQLQIIYEMFVKAEISTWAKLSSSQ